MFYRAPVRMAPPDIGPSTASASGARHGMAKRPWWVRKGEYHGSVNDPFTRVTRALFGRVGIWLLRRPRRSTAVADVQWPGPPGAAHDRGRGRHACDWLEIRPGSEAAGALNRP